MERKLDFIEKLRDQILENSEKFHKDRKEQQNRYEDQEHQSWSKAFELMAIISAGSFAVIASLSSEEPTWILKTAMILMLLTVVSVVIVFVIHSKILTYLKNDSMPDKSYFRFEKVRKHLKQTALYLFCGSNLALLLSVLF